MTKIIGSVENWENGTLGSDEKFAEIVESVTSEEADSKLALQMISIRLKGEMIESLKFIAKENGIKGYQPLIRRVLDRFVQAEMKMIAMELAKEQKEDVEDDAKRA